MLLQSSSLIVLIQYSLIGSIDHVPLYVIPGTLGGSQSVSGPPELQYGSINNLKPELKSTGELNNCLTASLTIVKILGR